jgi:hypothetical protein
MLLPWLVHLQDLRTVVLLNCGASSYVQDMAPSSCRNARFVVVDSHRPIHPRYNNASDMDVLLVLAADDPTPADEVPPASELDNMTPERESGSD